MLRYGLKARNLISIQKESIASIYYRRVFLGGLKPFQIHQYMIIELYTVAHEKYHLFIRTMTRSRFTSYDKLNYSSWK